MIRCKMNSVKQSIQSTMNWYRGDTLVQLVFDICSPKLLHGFPRLTAESVDGTREKLR